VEISDPSAKSRDLWAYRADSSKILLWIYSEKCVRSGRFFVRYFSAFLQYLMHQFRSEILLIFWVYDSPDRSLLILWRCKDCLPFQLERSCSWMVHRFLLFWMKSLIVPRAQ
jgi:hypothetical protein